MTEIKIAVLADPKWVVYSGNHAFIECQQAGCLCNNHSSELNSRGTDSHAEQTRESYEGTKETRRSLRAFSRILSGYQGYFRVVYGGTDLQKNFDFYSCESMEFSSAACDMAYAL